MKRTKSVISIVLLAVILFGIICAAVPSASAVTMDSSWTYDQYLADYYINRSGLTYYMEEDQMPFQTYVYNADRDLQNAMATWRKVTMSVSDLLTFSDKEVEFYMLLIYDVVYQNVSENSTIENVDSMLDAVEASSLVELIKTDTEQVYDSLLKTELTADNIDAFCRDLLGTAALKKLAKYSGAIIKAADKLDTLEDLLEKLALLKNFSECTDEVAEILSDMSVKASDPLLKEALLQMQDIANGLITDTDIDAIFSSEVLAHEIIDYACGKLWDATKKGVPLLGPFLAGAETGQQMGKLACSILFSTDAVCENWFSMEKITIFEETLQSCVRQYIRDFKVTPSQENAQLLNRAADMYMATMSVGMEYAIKYAQAAYGGGLCGWLYKKFNNDDYVKLLETLTYSKRTVDSAVLFVKNYSCNCYLAALEALLAEESIEAGNWETTTVVSSEEEQAQQQAQAKEDQFWLSNQNILLDTTLTEDKATLANFTVKSGATLSLDGHTLTVGGDFFLQAGTVNIGSGQLVVRGDLYLDNSAGTLNMGTGSITVEGNVYHSYGKLDMEQGRLTVGGDYRIQSRTVSGDGTESFSQSYGYLRMEYDQATITVGGDFVMQSRYDTNDAYNTFNAGTIAVAGDFRVIESTVSASTHNFATGGTHKVILNGTAPQTVCFTTTYAYFTSDFTTLEVQNSAGLILQGYFSADNLTSTLDAVTAQSDGAVIRKLTLGTPLHITGEVEIASGTTLLQTHLLRVDGDLIHSSGIVDIKAGTLEVTGDYRIQEKKTDSDGNISWSRSMGWLRMENTEGQVIVHGNLHMYSYYPCSSYNCFTAGTMTLYGDFIQQIYGYSGNYDNFRATGAHRVVFAGSEAQTVTLASETNYFNIVDIQNPAGIALSGYFRAASVTSTLAQPLMHPSEAVIAGMTLDTDLTLTAGAQIDSDVSLQAYTLTVQGELIQSSGEMNIGTGALCVTGNYRLQSVDADKEDGWGVGGNLNMEAEEARVTVGGGLYTYGDYGTKTAGTITVAGDCFHTSGFSCSGTHKVILNGTAPQRVGLTSGTYAFATLEVRNEAGLILEDYLRAASLTSTLDEVTAVSEGGKLHQLVLNTSLSITGDTEIANGPVQLQTHTLRVDGDLTHSDGKLLIEQGTLEVTGDYRIQKKVTATDGTVSWGQSNGSLRMEAEEARVSVGGDYVHQSRWDTDSSYNTFSAGILSVGGDFTQIDSSDSYDDNFQCSGTHKVVFNGTEPQAVTLETGSIAYFANVEVSNEAGLIFRGVYRGGTLTSTLDVINAISDGGILREVTLAAPLHITGDVRMDTNYLQTHTLRVDGNLYHTGGILYIQEGALEVTGDYRAQTVSTDSDGNLVFGGSNGVLYMEYDTGRVTINGSFISHCNRGNTGGQTAGIMTVGGDFIQLGSYASVAPSGTHKVILNGTKPQTVSLSNTSSFFNILEVQNEAGLILQNYFAANSLTTPLEAVTAVSEDASLRALTLDASMTVSGNVKIASGTVSLQSHTLRVEGDLIQSAGIMAIGGGTLEVTGDYRIETPVTADDGTVSWNSSPGVLRMTDSAAKVTVDGSFITFSNVKTSSSGNYNYLTAGTITVRGDFIQRGAYYNFQPSGVLVILDGTAPQTVSFYTTSCYFKTLEVRNEAGLILENSFRADSLTSPLEAVTAVSLDASIYRTTLNVPLHIIGDVRVDTLYLQTHTLRVDGDLTHTSGIMSIGQGTLEVTGDYRIQKKTTAGDGTVTWGESSGYLRMEDAAATVIVGGDFVTQSYYSCGSGSRNYYGAGTMYIGGNFTQIPSSYASYNNFSPYSTHKVVLNGTGHQTVTFGDNNSKFNILDLRQEGSQYTFSRVPCWNTLLNNGEAHAHTHVQTVVAPTCTEQGYTVTACYCGDSVTSDYTDALGHSYGAYVSDGNATCTADGTATAVCDRCGSTDTVTDEGSALGHSWDEGTVTAEPTEETTGLMTYTCTVCGEVKTEELPRLPHVHDYTAQVTAPTCETPGFTTYTCRCGDSYVSDHVDALGHSVEDYVCNVCGKTFVQILRQPVSVTVDEDAYAIVDFEIEGEDLTYEWYYANAGSDTFVRTRAFTGNTYKVKMNAARDGRRIYCVVTDIYGNTVTTDTVTLHMTPAEQVLRITRQPVSVTVAAGQMAHVDFEAEGEDLTYTWYYATADSDVFVKTSAFHTNRYYVPMTATRDGRRVYCVVTDIYGNTVTTDTVTLHMAAQALTIVSQPESVTVAEGEYAVATVEATGTGLTYEWYFSDNGGKSFSKTSSFTGNTYKVKMTAARSGRQVYCVITDANGSSVTTDIAVISMRAAALAIVSQPVSVTVAEGENAVVTVEATGTGLTYEWYFSDNGGVKFSKTSAFTGNTYKVKMTAARSGRQVYCVITDADGNSVKTNVATISMTQTLAIVTQPVSVTVAAGESAAVTVKAVGNGLTYAWYFSDNGGVKFSKTTAFTGNTYKVTMTAARNGRQVYCVITDSSGNSVKSNVATISMA